MKLKTKIDDIEVWEHKYTVPIIREVQSKGFLSSIFPRKDLKYFGEREKTDVHLIYKKNGKYTRAIITDTVLNNFPKLTMNIFEDFKKRCGGIVE